MNRLPDRPCPACGYDVGILLADGFSRCPECGGPISRELCNQRHWHFSRARWTWWYAAIAPSLALASLGPMFGGRWPSRRMYIPEDVVETWFLFVLVWCAIWSAAYITRHAPRAWSRRTLHLSVVMATIVLIGLNLFGVIVWMSVQGFACAAVDAWRAQ